MRSYLPLPACLWLIATLSTCVVADEARPKPVANAVRVAIFRDFGVSEKVAGLIELLKAQPQLAVTVTTAADIRSGILDQHDVVLFPGGSGSKEAAALEESGRSAVRSFVERGGGYLGICASAYLASADYPWSLHILDAKVLDRAHWARGSGDVEVAYTTAAKKLLGCEADQQTVLYWQGPLLAPAGKDEIPDFETLGTFATEIAKNGAPQGVMIGTTAIARGTFGSGRVFCFSPHPERTPNAQEQVLKAILWTAAGAHAAGEEARAAKLHRIDVKTAGGLKELLQFAPETLPLVSAHRGGPQTGYPENCLATFENTLRHTYALLEIDPRHAKDEIVVLHDPTLERTTTGTGRLSDFTLAELKKLRLKDTAGNVTDFQIPTLDEVLEWARGKTVLVLDQKDVSVPDRVKKIEQHQAEHYAMLIVYSFAEAKKCYELNPNIMMEVMIPNQQKAAEFDQLGVPWQNVIAFVGHVPPEDRNLYALIHSKGARTLIGTSRNLDRQFITGQAKMKDLEPGYRAFLERGADLIETDIPTQLGPLLYGSAAVPAAKRAYFHAE